jgi:lipooligosaccharide transport system ATP-binding protein
MITDNNSSKKPVLQAAGLTKKFGSRIAVDGIDLSVFNGECFGLLGPNGAGKTTTIQMILGMVEKTSGDLHIFGLKSPDHLRQIKSRIGVVPQNDNLDTDLSVSENLLTYASYYNLPRSKAIKRSNEMLHFFALESRKNDLIGHLSGGQRRRLLLARSLIHDPDLLILDEPTVGLDPQARYLIWERLQGLKEQGLTIILTSHYMDEVARLSDRILILDGGKIMATGSPQQMIDELVGLDVFEVSGSEESLANLLNSAAACDARCERVTDSLFIYTKKECQELENKVRQCEHWLRRPANLEDLFIQITGRTLHE